MTIGQQNAITILCNADLSAKLLFKELIEHITLGDCLDWYESEDGADVLR